MSTSAREPVVGAEAATAALRQVLLDYGRRISDSPSRLRAVLSDVLGSGARDARAALDALVLVAESGVASELRSSGKATKANVAALVEWGLTRETAAWACEAWTQGLAGTTSVGSTDPTAPASAGQTEAGQAAAVAATELPAAPSTGDAATELPPGPEPVTDVGAPATEVAAAATALPPAAPGVTEVPAGAVPPPPIGAPPPTGAPPGPSEPGRGRRRAVALIAAAAVAAAGGIGLSFAEGWLGGGDGQLVAVSSTPTPTATASPTGSSTVSRGPVPRITVTRSPAPRLTTSPTPSPTQHSGSTSGGSTGTTPPVTHSPTPRVTHTPSPVRTTSSPKPPPAPTADDYAEDFVPSKCGSDWCAWPSDPQAHGTWDKVVIDSYPSYNATVTASGKQILIKPVRNGYHTYDITYHVVNTATGKSSNVAYVHVTMECSNAASCT